MVQQTGTQKHDDCLYWVQGGSKAGDQSVRQTSPKRGRQRIEGQDRQGQEFKLR